MTFDSRFPSLKVTDEPVYKSENSFDGDNAGLKPVLFSSNVEVSFDNSLVETTLIGGINGTVTILADTLKAGDQIEFVVAGTYKKSVGVVTYDLRVSLGAFLPFTMTFLQGGAAATLPFEIVAKGLIWDDGGTLSIKWSAYLLRDGILPDVQVQSAASTYDNTIDNDLKFTGQISVASVDAGLSTIAMHCSVVKFV